MSIKRYDMERDGFDQSYMAEAESGDYVRYEDHAAEVADLTADRDSWSAQASERVKDWDEMRKKRDKLAAEVEALRTDAERYRWLRDGSLLAPKCDYPIAKWHESGYSIFDSNLDAAIDAARTAKEQP